jgi:hypothetical protein
VFEHVRGLIEAKEDSHMLKTVLAASAAVSLLITAPTVTPARAEGMKMAQGVDVQIGRDRDRYDRERRYDRDTTVGVGPGGVTIGRGDRCRMVTTRVERDDGSSFTRRERRCD